MRKAEPRISGIILAAGYGERMLPLTGQLPKPLIPILGVPLFEILVQKLVRGGAVEIHCNLFHLPGKIEKFAADRGWPVRFHREGELLGTGGGIGNMADGLADTDMILLHNGDILSGLGYESAISLHRKRGALVTLVLAPSGPRANVATDADDGVVAIGEGAEGHARAVRLLGYTGMAVLSPESLSFFPRGEKAHLVAILRAMIQKRPGSVVGWNAAASGARYAWADAGSPEGYLGIHRSILVDKVRFDPSLEPPPLSLHAGEGAVIDPGAQWKGFCEIGPRAVIERDARIEDCVVLADTVVERGSVHTSEILFPGGAIKVSGGS
jgi:mannose-1-phosphate guanylyltransferase/phosphomannomutase